MFPDLSHLGSYGSIHRNLQTTNFNLQRKNHTYIAGSISPTPHQSWVFLFPSYISDFSEYNCKEIHAEYIQCTNVCTEILCNIIVTILLLVLHSF